MKEIFKTFLGLIIVAIGTFALYGIGHIPIDKMMDLPPPNNFGQSLGNGFVYLLVFGVGGGFAVAVIWFISWAIGDSISKKIDASNLKLPKIKFGTGNLKNTLLKSIYND